MLFQSPCIKTQDSQSSKPEQTLNFQTLDPHLRVNTKEEEQLVGVDKIDSAHDINKEKLYHPKMVITHYHPHLNPTEKKLAKGEGWVASKMVHSRLWMYNAGSFRVKSTQVTT
jgi:hypothetical protein